MVHRLQQEAAALVMDRLVHRPEQLAVISPMGNPPGPELFFNTKISLQFSRCRQVTGQSEGHAQVALCESCIGKTSLDSRCSCGARGGCDLCIGKLLQCPKCSVKFSRQWTYETGSGRSSINRDINRCVLIVVNVRVFGLRLRVCVAGSKCIRSQLQWRMLLPGLKPLP